MTQTEEGFLGRGLKPGDPHYRAFIGPPEDYDRVAAMVFNLLTCNGLRQNHHLLDIGCGSLRIGRVLIPYLNPGCYFGYEPNQWLIKDGIAQELGQDIIKIKRPTFLEEETWNSSGLNFDFAFAQSIFSHCGVDLWHGWFQKMKDTLNPEGMFLFTYSEAEIDETRNGWFYPECVRYRWETVQALATEYGMVCHKLNWFHPRQKWVIATHVGRRTFQDPSSIHWNALQEVWKTSTTTLPA